MYKIAIAEDEIIYQEQIIEYLNRYQEDRKIALQITTFNDGDGLVENYTAQFDIILMDVQMQFMDGMSAAKEIRKIDSEVVIIFITNMDQFATKGYEVDALDYVLKPVSYFVFTEKLDRAIIRINNRRNTYILIDVKSGLKKIDLNDLSYIESQGHNVIYHTTSGPQIGKGALKEFEKKLEKYDFIRCNKGFLVNLKHVDGVTDGCAEINGEMIPIGRTRKTTFLEALTNYVSKVVK